MGEGISLFEMEMDFLYRKRIKDALESRYTDVVYTCNDTLLSIETGDGYYRGIGIKIKAGNFDFYKRGKENAGGSIYHFYDGRLKTIRGEENCDSPEEYMWLVENVIHPLQRAVMLMEEKGTIRQYVYETDVKNATGLTKAEYTESLNLIKTFVRDVEEVYGLTIIISRSGYYSREHYGTGITAILTIIDELDLMILHCKAGAYKVVVEHNTGVDRSIVIEVAKQVMKTRGYTKYNKKRLREG